MTVTIKSEPSTEDQKMFRIKCTFEYEVDLDEWFNVYSNEMNDEFLREWNAHPNESALARH